MKKRFDVYYTVPVRETLTHYKEIRYGKKKTNKWTGNYNTIQVGKNLKFKDALELIARNNYPDGFFELYHNGSELCFGSRHGDYIDLTNSRDFHASYIYKIKNPESLYPHIYM